MGMSAPTRKRTSRRGNRVHAPLSEINVTPFVDVMLVLLIIFMVAAPLLTTGVPLNLPRAKSAAIETNIQPITISVTRQGEIFLISQGESEVAVSIEDLSTRLRAIAANDTQRTVFVRGDTDVDFGAMMKVMATITEGGFSKVSLLTNSEGAQ